MNRLYSAALFALLFTVGTTAGARAEDTTPPLATALAAAPATACAALCQGFGATVHHLAKAPADEYFGRFKMSILGVRNTVADIDGRVDLAADDVARNLCHKLTLAEDALRDWHAKYPDDTWIPKLGYAMVRDYQKIDALILSEEFHDATIHALDLGDWLDATFPNSEFAPK